MEETMRGNPRNDLDYAVGRAVELAVRAVNGPTVGSPGYKAGRGDSGAPPVTFTVAATDGSGNVYTQHQFITGLDSTDTLGPVTG